jgi:mono/diheme cytochrome c family protein
MSEQEKGGGSSATWKIVAVGAAVLLLAGVGFLWRPTPALKSDAPVVVQPNPATATSTTNELAPGSVEFYEQRVKPIFVTNCYRCHGGMNHKGGLSIATMAGMLKGGHDGSVLVPGHPEQSMLIKLIRHEGPKNDPMPMPPAPRGKISDADIATVTAWVAAGAPMSAPE